jgi:glycosyltransferase 2 family protein
VAVAAGALLLKAFAGIDLAAAWRAAAGAGRWAPFALAPFAAAMTLDAAGIGLLLGALGRRVPLARLVAIRIATEALHLTAPAGFVVADTATAALLDARCGVPVAEGAVIAIARKWLVTRSHAVYILLGAICGATALGGVSARLVGGRWLPWAVGASALAPLAISVTLGAGFRGQPALLGLQGAMGRLPWPALRERVSRWRCGAVAFDGHLARVGRARGATRRATLAYFASWLLEALETMLILRLVGGPLDIGLAMAAEVGVSLVRSIGNVAPAGLGVQDAGYAVLFEALGVPAPTTAAFVLLKRAKELVWIACGYGLLAAMRRRAASESARIARGVAGSAPMRTIFGETGGAAPGQPAV